MHHILDKLNEYKNTGFVGRRTLRPAFRLLTESADDSRTFQPTHQDKRTRKRIYENRKEKIIQKRTRERSKTY